MSTEVQNTSSIFRRFKAAQPREPVEHCNRVGLKCVRISAGVP